MVIDDTRSKFMLRLSPHPYYRSFSAFEHNGGDVADPHALAAKLREFASALERRYPDGFPPECDGPSYDGALPIAQEARRDG
jgi:hypothetical protein